MLLGASFSPKSFYPLSWVIDFGAIDAAVDDTVTSTTIVNAVKVMDLNPVTTVVSGMSVGTQRIIGFQVDEGTTSGATVDVNLLGLAAVDADAVSGAQVVVLAEYLGAATAGAITTSTVFAPRIARAQIAAMVESDTVVRTVKKWEDEFAQDEIWTLQEVETDFWTPQTAPGATWT
jgi:hypothetical protein